LRHALARLVPEIAAVRPGIPLDALRESLAAAFDLYIEVGKMRDGRVRILRIAEPSGVESNAIGFRDVFTFATERTAAGGSIEGSFHPTGVVPRVADDLQSRGIPVDAAMFRR